MREMNFGTSVTVRLIRCPLNAGYVGSFVSNMKEKRFSEKNGVFRWPGDDGRLNGVNFNSYP